MSKHIEFKLIMEGPRTNVWAVTSKTVGPPIGYIQWYSPWRQYCLEPEPNTVWARSCLQDVADFIKEQMEAKR